MKKLSVRAKLTLWFSVALAIVVAVTVTALLYVSNRVLQKTVRDTLVEAVSHNVDEIEFYTEIPDVDLTQEPDHYIRYQDGYLQIDDDFLDEVNLIYSALYESDGSLLYGENPIAREVQGMAFRDSVVQKKTVRGTLYYIFDRKLQYPGLEDLWLRGVVSEHQGQVQLQEITALALVALPTLMLLAILGGYFLAGRVLRPVGALSAAADRIRKGNDLKKRIDLGPGEDELHRLADSFNEMFRRLEAAFDAERQFTSDVSHELRTPVTVIMAQCELALEDAQTPEEYADALQVVQRQGKRMERLIEDMLAVTRLEGKGEQYPKEKLNLTELVASVCTDMALVAEKGISLSWEGDESIFLAGNAQLLSRLLTNLIANAYRYGREQGHIWVRLHRGKDGVVLSVKDDGVGMAAQHLEKIFNRFYQIDSARSGEGTGLGLAMVAEIARFHGGAVAVESEEGKGSEFFVTFSEN